jgi:hypothetical protein
LADTILETSELVDEAIDDLDIEVNQKTVDVAQILSQPLNDAYKACLKDLRFGYADMKNAD